MSGGMQPDWKAALRTLVRTGARTLTGAGLPSSVLQRFASCTGPRDETELDGAFLVTSIITGSCIYYHEHQTTLIGAF